MPEDKLINVFGCSRCKKLAGDITGKRVVQGYEQCPECHGDLGYFWLNLTKMKFQASRQVPIEEANRLADEIGGFLTIKEVGKAAEEEVTTLLENFPPPPEMKPWWKRS